MDNSKKLTLFKDGSSDGVGFVDVSVSISNNLRLTGINNPNLGHASGNDSLIEGLPSGVKCWNSYVGGGKTGGHAHEVHLHNVWVMKDKADAFR